MCEWYDYQSCTCNIDDCDCPFAADNNKGMYGVGVGLTCEKLNEQRDE